MAAGRDKPLLLPTFSPGLGPGRVDLLRGWTLLAACAKEGSRRLEIFHHTPPAFFFSTQIRRAQIDLSPNQPRPVQEIFPLHEPLQRPWPRGGGYGCPSMATYTATAGFFSLSRRYQASPDTLRVPPPRQALFPPLRHDVLPAGRDLPARREVTATGPRSSKKKKVCQKAQGFKRETEPKKPKSHSSRGVYSLAQ